MSPWFRYSGRNSIIPRKALLFSMETCILCTSLCGWCSLFPKRGSSNLRKTIKAGKSGSGIVFRSRFDKLIFSLSTKDLVPCGRSLLIQALAKKLLISICCGLCHVQAIFIHAKCVWLFFCERKCCYAKSTQRMWFIGFSYDDYGNNDADDYNDDDDPLWVFFPGWKFVVQLTKGRI